jgi:hypothetical protein
MTSLAEAEGRFPDLDLVLHERTAALVRHVEELRRTSGLISGSSSMSQTPLARLRPPF